MSVPTFDEFFCAVHGARKPFPWQSRLAREVLERGWPSLLDLPTGAGKTSALDVALYALAVAPQRMPRRTVLVVDRRIVVEQGAAHAKHLLSKLQQAVEGPGRFIADALRALWGGEPDSAPFYVATLRGGMPRDNDWARRPDQPVLGLSTVDQVGSRLLFRGYGVSERSASIHAGLLGNDTLLLLDEVHLAEPFAQTLEAVQTRLRREVTGLPDRFRVVRMSATPGKSSTSSVFSLGADDRADPVLTQRLAASKRTRLVPVKVTGDDESAKRQLVAEAAVQHALALQKSGSAVVAIVVNRVDTARLALAVLRDRHPTQTDAALVTGRMRPIDRDDVVRRVLLPRCAARDERSRDRQPLVLVATQCIEAGADLDFDGLVTECASLDALRQRFGRLDRRGALGTSPAVVLGRLDLVSGQRPDPIYGSALAATWSWLTEHGKDGIVDFGIDALARELGSGANDALMSPRPNAPVLLPAQVDAWTQTSPRPDYDPDISLWLHGPEKPVADVQVVWRADLVVPGSEDDADRALRESIATLAACRPSTLEALTVPLGAARHWLDGHGPTEIADVLGAEPGEEPPRRSREVGPKPYVALRWQGDDSRWIRASELRPGDILVLPSARGGIRNGSFDPDAQELVRDLGTLASLRARAQLVLRGVPGTLDSLGITAELADGLPDPREDESRPVARERLREWAAQLPADPPAITLATPKEWGVLVAVLASKAALHIVGERTLVLKVPKRLLLAELDEAVTEDDDSSFVSAEVTLKRHSDDVRSLAERFARAVGFGAEIVADLSRAGWLHDIGKADPRFQRWLVGGSEVRTAMLREPLAKSALAAGSRAERDLARRRAGYPQGYRHELLSLALASADGVLEGAHDPDLVLHLVASHHGFCRPFAPFEDHPEDTEVALNHGQQALRARTRHRFARLDSGVAERFFRLVDRYGWWGLAWLEAVLRLADHRASDGSLGGDA